ncbi:accessory gene regulator ArgB-like protein [Paenibacillus solisilvae]|uniref:Accessory gene regulator ArgB-like protein n=1 Tax=Paenibacillus solisilvae TaxID=2486751 RepID=A0ABW0W425_9BACL
MIDAISKKLAINLKNAVPDHPYSEAKLQFGIHLLLNTSFTITMAVILGLVFIALPETMLCLFSFALLRMVSGGYHFNSAVLCITVSAAVAVSLPFIAISDKLLIAINASNVILAFLFAPSRIEGQTRIPKRYFKLLKWITCCIAASNFIFNSPLLGLTWLLQTASLIRIKGGENK